MDPLILDHAKIILKGKQIIEIIVAIMVDTKLNSKIKIDKKNDETPPMQSKHSTTPCLKPSFLRSGK